MFSRQREPLRCADPLVVHVVDDDSSVRRAIGRLLKSLGLTARTFESGAALLADERCSEACCTVIDVHMPEMSGYEVARRLAKTHPEIRVILVTARAEERVRWRSEAAQATGLLLKPFSEEELVAALEHALGRYVATPPLH